MSDYPPSAISRQTIKDLAKLARLDLTPEEEVSYQQELGAIVQFVNQLKEADVSGCQPLHQVTGLVNRWREDKQESLRSEQHPSAEKLLSFLTDRLVDGQFKAPRPLTEQPAANNN